MNVVADLQVSLLLSRGFGKWQDEERTICAISYKSFSDWANIIYSWGDSTGQVGEILIVTINVF